MTTVDKYAHKRVRVGKTRRDKASGAWAARFKNREKPIRRTSSYNGQDNAMKGVEFWGG